MSRKLQRRVRTIVEFLDYDDKSKKFIDSPWVATNLGPEDNRVMINCWRLVSVDNQRFMQINFKLGDKYLGKEDMAQLLNARPVKLSGYLNAFTWSTDTLLRIDFQLLVGKGFIESGLELLLDVLLAFGVERSIAKEYLRGFHTIQETEIKWHNEWMGFEQYLRLTLPVLLEE